MALAFQIETNWRSAQGRREKRIFYKQGKGKDQDPLSIARTLLSKPTLWPEEGLQT